MKLERNYFSESEKLGQNQLLAMDSNVESIVQQVYDLSAEACDTASEGLVQLFVFYGYKAILLAKELCLNVKLETYKTMGTITFTGKKLALQSNGPDVKNDLVSFFLQMPSTILVDTDGLLTIKFVTDFCTNFIC